MSYSDLPQPRHVPGYTGHQPTQQARVGETFGNVSHDIFCSTQLPRARMVSDDPFDCRAVTSTPKRRATSPATFRETPHAERLDVSDVSSTGSAYEDRRGDHHLPGYGGHVPTARGRVGETFGNTTYTVMRDESLPRARRLSDVTPIRPHHMHDDHGRTPGYAGHVPSLRGRVGSTYGRDTSALITDKTVYQGRSLSDLHIANTSIQESPLEPSFMPGYSGHTPKLQEMCGATYGRSTHDLMKDESNKVRRKISSTPNKVVVRKQEKTTTIVEENGNMADSETREPHYVPGYTGFTPQLQYRIGDTYGRATHELLLDPNVDHARQLALSDRSTDDYKVVTQTTTATRTVETGTEPISRRPTIPGYDTFVARMRGKRGQRFSINVRETDTQQEITRTPRSMNSRQLMGTTYSMPLQKVTPAFRKRWPATEEQVKTSPESPYFMKATDPNKMFITGYAGHLPFRNDHIGLHNAAFTNSALYDFTSNYRMRQSTEWAPVNIVRPDPPLFEHRSEIYHKNTPLIPNYTGHVPGSIFRCGLTFGNNSIDASKALRGDRY